MNANRNAATENIALQQSFNLHIILPSITFLKLKKTIEQMSKIDCGFAIEHAARNQRVAN